MSVLNKEPVKRVERFLKGFDQNLKVILLDTSARTALEAAEKRIYDQYERQATMTYGDRLMELYENAALPSDYFENNY